jgi:hypothetical protein
MQGRSPRSARQGEVPHRTGPVSLSAQKFMNGHRGTGGTGGAGAIDRVMHLAEMDFLTALVGGSFRRGLFGRTGVGWDRC